jgi:putative tricarboxylic transport membrane protein
LMHARERRVRQCCMPGRRRWVQVLILAVVAGLALVAGGCAGGAGGGAAEYPSQDIEIMAPADPGGGWDQTARTMQQTLTEGDVVDQNVEVYNVGGGSGTIGLAQFVGDEVGNPHQLMVMGLVMVGGIHANDSPVDLSQTTPIASLITEWEAIVVDAESEYESLEQLIEDFKADPRSISWGGGSAGGADHILVGRIAQEVGVDPANINYIAHAGGGEAVSAILSGAVTVGVSGLAEFAGQIEAGEMRLLAVSSDEPIEGVDAPTITESGVDVVFSNWRGVVAPPDISDEDRDAIIAMVEEMHETAEWQEALEANNWTDFFMTGDEFGEYLEEENMRVEQVIEELGLAR